MHMTKHVFGAYSTVPGPVAGPGPVPAPVETPVVARHEGDAVVAAYSVIHDRDGSPARALLVCDLPGGARTYAKLTDQDACARAEHEELVGATVRLETRRTTGPLGDADVNYALW